ncbi:MAG: TIGR02450 family Trp-rich protein [Alteromonadales bacterium]|nr:TIGR02450 family Trp-rich protein [Alteromonadales bacterium]
MTKINPAKLRNSKWTSINPKNKERHFLISDVEFDEEGAVINCKLESVYSKNEYSIDWRELKNNGKWIQGWK